MKRNHWIAIGVVVVVLLAVLYACGHHGPKNYLATQRQDAQRAMDSMPSPTGGN